MQYAIVEWRSISELVEFVQEAIEKWFTPIGGIAIEKHEYWVDHYYQAMTKTTP